MNRTDAEIRQILATFQQPDRAAYLELDGYSRDDIYREFFGRGGLYLTVRTGWSVPDREDAAQVGTQARAEGSRPGLRKRGDQRLHGREL